MKIFSSEQVRAIDEYTIGNEPVTSADLMERAAGQLFNWYTSRFSRSERVIVFTGPGNNGGDGLALARMLNANRYDVEVYHIQFSDNRSPEWERNRVRLEEESAVFLHFITSAGQFPVIYPKDIIIDAIFGSGLSREVSGLPAEIISEINNADSLRISVDIPSGLFGEDNTNNSYRNVVKADYTLCFEFPKLAFMFPENFAYTGEWGVLPIGLHPNATGNTQTPYFFIEKKDVKPLIKTRNKFGHKGNFGHGLLVSGSSGKLGASVLSARSALRTGIGLLTCHLPSGGSKVLNSSIPEAMSDEDTSEVFITMIGSTDKYSSVGIGPGLGIHEDTQTALYNLITECEKPMVIDADALNILSLHKDWLSALKPGTVLTPHPKEFERLAGVSVNGYERLIRQIGFSKEHKCVVVLKGANTSISTPDGKVYFNSTGNPGMATAGSGDVLTGIILSLLAQGISSENAALLGVYLHGLAGDIAAEESCFESLIASDIINCLGKAFNRIRQ